MIKSFHGMHIRARVFFLILILLVPILILERFHTRAYGQKSAGGIEKVRVADGRFLPSAPINLAVEKGYFKEEGLEISRSLFWTGKECLAEVMAGKADLAAVADFPIALEAMKGARICVIATLSNPGKTFAIIGRKDQGISFPKDLQGKKIGTTLGTNLNFILDSFLLFHHVPRKDIRLVDLPMEQMPEALRKGDVQAVITWEPFLSKIRTQLGTDAVIFHGDEQHIYRMTWNIVGMREFVHKNPETIKRVLRALLKAEGFIKKNRNDALRMTAAHLGMEKEVLRETWDAYTPDLSLSPLLVENLENETRWAIKNQIAPPKQMPNYLNYIYFDGLESVKPEAVTIVH
jgi:NitT/TauT family transport system substrate-binding protein